MGIADWLTLLASATGISLTVAYWLSKRLVDHRLKKDLEERKAELKATLEKEKALWEGRVKEEVETVLANRAANREYELDARKRLYLAIGPLRFQLLTACRDLEGRITARGMREDYGMDVDTYYGRSSLYRILNPLVLADLAERQMAYADFSVDPAAVHILQFRRNGFGALTGGRLVMGHSKVDWDRQEQHVFHDNLARALNTLVVTESAGLQRGMRPPEFEALVKEEGKSKELDPFPRILARFTPEAKPLFWLRLVAYAYLCNWYINKCGVEVGFEKREFPLEDLLKRSRDKEILDALPEYVARCVALPASTL